MTHIDNGRRPEVLAVEERLKQTSIDGEVTFDQLSDVAGRDLRQQRWIIIQARKNLSKEHGIQFATIRGLGFRRLAPAEGVRYAGEIGRKRTRNAARNGRRNLVNALSAGNDLSPEQIRAADQQVAAFGLIDYLSQPRTVRQLPEKKPEGDDLAKFKEALGIK